MRIIAWIVTAFWTLSLILFVMLPYFFVPYEHQISGEGGRFLLAMFTISVLGLAVIRLRPSTGRYTGSPRTGRN